jgi:hypothetical protein
MSTWPTTGRRRLRITSQDEEKRIKHVQHVIDVFRSSREVGRRNRMPVEGKRAEKKRFAKFLKNAEEERAMFEKHRTAAVQVHGFRAHVGGVCVWKWLTDVCVLRALWFGPRLSPCCVPGGAESSGHGSRGDVTKGVFQ